MVEGALESTIAEKFEAIVSLGEANGRMKDFYGYSVHTSDSALVILSVAKDL
ncbi:MAG: nucleotidyl transferase AbiEii/AbiGii toxin family protein [Lachnospiraceae bacterium]|nr:nucleotidyl transferase AbiEii/AbiGii toxin family protein [Lachnospiraceae bacterium]